MGSGGTGTPKLFQEGVYRSQLGKDSEAFSKLFCREGEPAAYKADVAESFLAGASRTLTYFEQFLQRVERDIQETKATEFERGQLDGIRWVDDHLKTLFNL